MTRKEVQQAIALCSPYEIKVLLECTPHEVGLMLEAKLYADATIRSMPREVYGVIAPRKDAP